ncbi:hypothetical protein [Prosthecochloris sp. HL-130-GSB]|jgi:nickel transport protein|uniref:Carboxypeptidase regulatory-like domain-containing protein n=1 Tax=Prosthecochloris aestuarii TaxID=1102 RepID=A0A831SUT4_PROAE|nr:hypothetical protein [Prosthecochloris sp. HL-130-GSB]ARM30761.1 hypothetical protein B9H02_04870 [Prosthecochloris sp. HL-130-GSB]MBO8093131.1 hypothetical protein [Prosthecochloris sp.]HED31273.1 hypothetical protein [Prosthecochloris aestuarii]
MTVRTRILICLLLLMPAVKQAEAHKINLFCWYEADSLLGEGYFRGGNPVKNSRVILEDAESGKLIDEGITSESGKFGFRSDPSIAVTVVLDAGQGHRATWTWEGTEWEAPGHQATEGTQSGPTLLSWMTAFGGIVLMFTLLYLWKRKDEH